MADQTNAASAGRYLAEAAKARLPVYLVCCSFDIHPATEETT